MRRIPRSSSLVLLAILLAACAGRTGPAWAPAPIGDLASVRGTWAGLMLRDPAGREDWLELTIAPDGSFQGKSYRQIGALSGSGHFTLVNGRLEAKTARASLTGALFQADGRRMLRIEATTTDGLRFRAELEPAQ